MSFGLKLSLRQKRNYDQEIREVATNPQSVRTTWYCVFFDGDYCLGFEPGISVNGRHPIRILATGNLKIIEQRKFKFNLEKEKRPTYGKNVKVLSVRNTTTPTGPSYTKKLEPATVCKKIEGEPAKYQVKFGSGEVEEIPETLIVPLEAHWSNPKTNYVASESEKTEESEKSSSDSESESSESESSSSTSSSSSSSSTSSSTSSSSSSSTSSSDSSDSSDSKHRHHHSKRGKRKHPRTMILPIFIPISPYGDRMIRPQQYWGIPPQISRHKHHKHHHRH